jgi:hypothetical protein
VILTAAAMSVGLIGFLGLATDVGYLQWTQRCLQTAADSGAIAGAQEMLRGSSNTVVATAAKNDASLNGATNGTGGVTITVNSPPASGSYTTGNTAVEVIVKKSAPLYFMGVFGATSATVGARAVARLGNTGNCLYTLDPTKANSLYLNGAFNVNMSCGAMIDSSNSQAMYLNGAINWTGSSNVVGNYYENGAINMSPAPKTGISAQSDPLAYVQPPTVGACNYTNYSITGAYNKTLSPGVYCGGITINGAGTVNFSAGTYILEGGGLSVIGANILNGAGVTFYDTQGGGYSYGPVSITGATIMNFSAPTSGSLASMLFFQDRTIASPAASTFVGATSATMTGSIYFPTSALTYTGASAGSYTIIVADTVTFSGAANIGANYSSLPGGVSPAKNAVMLAE